MPKITNVFNILKEKHPDCEPEIKKGLMALHGDRVWVELFRENRDIFTKCEEYGLAKNGYGYTPDIQKMSALGKEKMQERYRLMTTRELDRIKNSIFSAVSYQKDSLMIYKHIDKYAEQLEIIDEVMQEKKKEKDKTAEKEIAEKLEETFVK